jgi:beta-galactosidase
MRYCVLLCGLLFVGGIGLAQDRSELEEDHNVRTRLATPHTDWAVPYRLGRTRVLFFLRGHGTGPREVIELQQRFEFDSQMVFWARVIDSTQEGWHGAERGVERMARLLAERWDVFVFLAPEGSGTRDVTPDMLPVEQQLKLLEAVTAGAGLVLVGNNDARVLKEKNRLARVPDVLADVDGAATFTVKQGRAVRLPKRPAADYRPGWEVQYDEWAMRVGKAILWAAGKEPPLRLTLRAQAQPLAGPTLPGVAATLHWHGAASGSVAHVTLRRDDGRVLFTRQQPLAGPDGTADLTVPQLRSGAYYLDVVARRDGRVDGWASTQLTVACPQAVELTLDPAWAEVGQTLAGKVRLTGPALPGQQVLVQLIDRRGRHIAQQVIATNAATSVFRFPVQPWFPMLVEVRATLLEGKQEVAAAWQFAHVVQRHRGQFNFVMWDVPRGALAPWAEQALATSGVTIHLASGTPPPQLAAYQMAWIPYTTHVDAKQDAQGIMKPCCWADAAKLQKHVDTIVEKHVAARQHGVFVYSLGDEIAVRGSCLSPHCLAAYRQYLAEQYGDIAALNASWGTHYTRFDEVQLSTPDDNDETTALRAGNFPRWFDRQAYQSHNFCQLCTRFGAGFRRLDRESRCGFEGAGTFTHADDLDGFVRANTFWSPYPGTADEVVRSIAPRDFPRANWMGYTKDADTLVERYWRMITRGCDSVWWWRWDAMGRFHGWLAPNLDPYPAVQEILRDTQIVRDGLGDLLLHATLETDGVGMLFSHASAYAAKVQAGPSFGTYEGSHTAWHTALRELGLNFRYFTDRQMRQGEVDLSRFRAIVLPMTQALGPGEVALLREYVRGGGLLVADVRPAIYDGHVKPLAAGQLDELFGVRRTSCAAAIVADATLETLRLNEISRFEEDSRRLAPALVPGVPGTSARAKLPGITQLDLARLRVDPGVAAAGATAAGAAGKVPLLLQHRFGQGQTVLLNVTLPSLPPLNAEHTPEAVAQLLRRILAQGHVAPAFALAAANGQRLRNVELTRWTSGPVEIVSVFRHHGRAEPARLDLRRPMYVYDLKGRRALGRQQIVDLTLTPFRAMFFAISPQPLAPVALQLAPAASAGSVARLTIAAAPTAGRQAVVLQVRLPDGRAADWVRRVVVADAQGVAVDVPVAYNDPGGTWTIEATDLYTATPVKAQFTVSTQEGGRR